MPHLMRWLLLLSCTAIWVHTQQKVDLNHLFFATFFVTREESDFMDQLQQHFVLADGTMDEAAYDKELKRSNPSLHIKMVEFRRKYIEIDGRYPGAARFFEALYRCAQNVRYHMDESEQTKTVLENFDGLSEAAQDYLIDHFPALNSLRSLTSRKPTSGVTTTKSAATTTATPSSKSNTAAQMKAIIGKLDKATKLIASSHVNKLMSLLTWIKKIESEQSPWDAPQLFTIFNLIEEAAKALQKCGSQCEHARPPMEDVFDVVLKAAIEVKPQKKLKQISNEYSMKKLSTMPGTSYSQDVFELIKEYSGQAKYAVLE